MSGIEFLNYFFLCGVAFADISVKTTLVKYLIRSSSSFSDNKCDTDEKSEIPAKERPKNRKKGVELWRLTALQLDHG